MAILDILQFPDPRLRTKAKPVTEVDAAMRKTIEDMYETMYDARGVGLAGTQVDYHYRLFTMDCSATGDEPQVIINPEIVHKEGQQYETHGCLSVPEAYDKVKRALKVRLKAFDIDMKPIEIEGEGVVAECFQHEIDHLNGILFIDHLSKLKQARIRKKIEKYHRRES